MKKINKPLDDNFEIKRVKSFFEEFSWLISSYSDVNFKKVSNIFKAATNKANVKVKNFANKSTNKQYLVGVLPELLNDMSIFVTNEDIANFSKTVLEVDIPNYAKKSRYELIGHIVCQTNALDDYKLSDLVKALEVIVAQGEKGKIILKEKKNNNFAWNSIIQDLIGALDHD